eukprot:COSAG03_NODE_338_length_8851_cov_33.536106_9_plen_43_part_00
MKLVKISFTYSIFLNQLIYIKINSLATKQRNTPSHRLVVPCA